MRLAAVIVVFMAVQDTPSEASKSCMTRTEARQHFDAVHFYWHGKDHCWDATPTRRHHQIHKVQQNIDEPNWRESMSKILPEEEKPVQTLWVDRWVDIEPAQLPIVPRRVDIVQVAPPIERDPEPMVTLRGVVMVSITIALTLTIIPRRFNYLYFRTRRVGRR
jgi:hypothetical protein